MERESPTVIMPAFWALLRLVLGNLGLVPPPGLDHVTAAKLVYLVIEKYLSPLERAAIWAKFAMNTEAITDHDPDLMDAIDKLKRDEPRHILESMANPWQAVLDNLYKMSGATAPLEPHQVANPRDISIEEVLSNIGPMRIGVLGNSGIKTLGDLTRKTAGDLLKFRQFGPETILNIRRALAKHGLTLRGDPPINTNAP